VDNLKTKWKEVAINFVGSIIAFLSCVFGVLNYMGVRRVGKSVHSSIKTMYLGIVALIISIPAVFVIQPDYFKIWDPSKVY
jgi:uncharacterized membrane protein